MAMMMTVMNMMMIMILMMIMIMIMTVIMIMITMMIMTKLLLRLMMTMMAASIAMPWPRVSAVLFGQHFNYGTSSESCIMVRRSQTQTATSEHSKTRSFPSGLNRVWQF